MCAKQGLSVSAIAPPRGRGFLLYDWISDKSRSASHYERELPHDRGKRLAAEVSASMAGGFDNHRLFRKIVIAITSVVTIVTVFASPRRWRMVRADYHEGD
jgi:hypothetical protein